MSTKPQVKVIGYFAKKAPLCVIIRKGPRTYSHMTLWRTDSDEFTPGQWVRGRVDRVTMTSDAKYLAVSLMGAKSRVHSWEDTQLSFICRPPYFTALEAWIGGLCVSTVSIGPNDILIYTPLELPGIVRHVVHSKNRCLLARVLVTDFPAPYPGPHDYVVDGRFGPQDGMDQQGRAVRFAEGKVFDMSGEEPRLLFDAHRFSFEPVVAPDWAKEW